MGDHQLKPGEWAFELLRETYKVFPILDAAQQHVLEIGGTGRLELAIYIEKLSRWQNVALVGQDLDKHPSDLITEVEMMVREAHPTA